MTSTGRHMQRLRVSETPTGFAPARCQDRQQCLCACRCQQARPYAISPPAVPDLKRRFSATIGFPPDARNSPGRQIRKIVDPFDIKTKV